MPESQQAHLEVLTDAEREALERPGLKQRAKALVAATEFTTKIGLSEDSHAVLLERLRGLNKGDAKLAWETLGDMNELLTMLEIDMSVGSEGVIELHVRTSPEVVEPVEEAKQVEAADAIVPPAQPEGEAEPTAEPEAEKHDSTQAPVAESTKTESSQPVEAPVLEKLSIIEALDSLIGHEDGESGYKIERVESVLEQLRKGGVDLGLTADDFTHEVLKQLALIYSESTKAEQDAVRTNIACTWGWLSGIDMAELVIWRRSTKPDAKAVDVHNSRSSFVNGVIKGWKQGLRPTFEEAEDVHEVLHLVKDETASVSEAAAAEEPSEVEATPEKYERPIDEEPRHVQLVDAYVEQLNLPVNKRAFEGLLDPKDRGDHTPAKALVLESLRHRVGTISADGKIFDELLVNARAKGALRKMLGLGFMKGGKAEEKPPVTLKDQLRSVDIAHHKAYTEDLYSGLEALLDALVKVSEQEEVPKAPLRVVFDGDNARLA